MRLSIYLKANEISMAEFGRQLGKDRSQILRYCDLSRIPKIPTLIKIRKLTGGRVGTFDDWVREGDRCLML